MQNWIIMTGGYREMVFCPPEHHTFANQNLPGKSPIKAAVSALEAFRVCQATGFLHTTSGYAEKHQAPAGMKLGL